MIEFRVVGVTPEQASEWLTMNLSNRPLKNAAIDAFAEDMRMGRWFETAEPVKFTGSPESPGLLLDGQNRLAAIVRSGATVILPIAYRVPRHAQQAMDSGTKRTAADQLALRGYSNVAITAAAAKIALRVKLGRLGGGSMTTNMAIEDWIEKHPTIVESTRIASRYYRRTDVAPSMVAYTHFVFSELDPKAATKFWVDASEKIGLEAGDPVIALTNRFAEARRQRERVAPAAALSAIFRAWNARRAGEQIKHFRFTTSGEGSALVDIPEVI